MITELGIANFKAFGKMQRVPIKPLTLIFGANSSGKSSIIQALLLAYHGMKTGDFDIHQPSLATGTDLGGFRRYIHKHITTNAIEISVEIDIDRPNLAEWLDGKAREKEPFLKASRFGLSITVRGGEGLAKAIDDAGLSIEAFQLGRARGRWTAAGIERITVLLDGQELLAFSPELGIPNFSGFRTQVGPKGHFIEQLVMDFVQMGGSSDHAVPTALKEMPKGAYGSSAGVEDANESNEGRLQGLLAEAIGERCFYFGRFVLRDDGYLGPTTRATAKWKVVQEGIGLLEFYHEATAWEHPRPWWAEAQAIVHNLAGLIEFCSEGIRRRLADISYLGPLRCVPARYVVADVAQDIRMDDGGGRAWENLARNSDVLEKVNSWLGADRLRTSYRLKHRRLFDSAGRERRNEVFFEDIQAQTELSHRDIGFGIGQVLPVLANAATLKSRLCLIEQPELHLHPAQQAELGDVFIESALGERKNTFILETHSEHLILRILRRVRETSEGSLPKAATPVRPEDVSVVYVEPGTNGAHVKVLPVTSDGDFACPWPGGFFAERLQELP